MVPAKLACYRRRLTALLSRLDRDRSQLKAEALQATGGEASGGLSDVPLHLADLGSRSFEEDVTLTLLENEEQLIEEVNLALARIDQQTFGRCEGCLNDIRKERLRAVPYARYCAPCGRKFQRPLSLRA
jgi:RNA polymerase-binding transcription factor DksA